MKRVTIIGAGIVGICSALSLQREGHEVTLMDPLLPGRGCSFGNAGLIQPSACVPIATLGVLRAVPRMLLDPDQPLVIRWRHIASLAPYLARFMVAARPARVEAISRALASLLAIAPPSWGPLIAQIGAGALVRSPGELHVWRSETAFRAAMAALDLRRRSGVHVEILERSDAFRMEPALANDIRHAVFLPEAEQVLDPYDLTAHLAAHFVRQGGSVLQEEVREILPAPDGAASIVTDVARRDAEHLVIAAGAHSKRLARQLGSHVPLDSERGYHLMLPDPGVELKVPLMLGDHRFAIVQMTRGIRLAGTAELAALGAPPDYRRAQRLLQLAQRVVPELNAAGAVPWMGQRPSTPDILRVICRSPRQARVFFAFGHAHLGLTLAAATGRVIADLVAGREPPVDLAPFHVARYRAIF